MTRFTTEELRELADKMQQPLGQIERDNIAAALRYSANVIDAANAMVEETRCNLNRTSVHNRPATPIDGKEA